MTEEVNGHGLQDALLRLAHQRTVLFPSTALASTTEGFRGQRFALWPRPAELELAKAWKLAVQVRVKFKCHRQEINEFFRSPHTQAGFWGMGRHIELGHADIDGLALPRVELLRQVGVEPGRNSTSYSWPPRKQLARRSVKLKEGAGD